MNFQWIHDNPPHWDDSKAAVIGGAPEGIFARDSWGSGDLLPGEWWRVEEDGRVLGYGWMDTTWGDAEILLAVDPAGRGRGVGTFILEHLEREAAGRGLNYLYNVVRATHPDREGVTRWLKGRHFDFAHDDDRLMRRVRQAK